MNLKGKYNFIEGKGWLGVIFDDTLVNGKKTVITVGVEDTEYEITEWLEGSLASMCKGGKELPDKKDRQEGRERPHWNK